MIENASDIAFDRVDLSKAGPEFWAAYVKFSGEVENAEKNKSNPHFKSVYADLAAAMNACRETLAANGLAVMQHALTGQGNVTITTILAHTSGQYVSSELTLRPLKNEPQPLGSAITYARRYAYMAITGIAAEDDDGNAASEKSSRQTPPPPAKKTEADLKQLVAEIEAMFLRIPEDQVTTREKVRDYLDNANGDQAKIEWLHGRVKQIIATEKQA
jgi:hypothetical protein